MTTAPFTIERTYNAPIAKVWEAITNKDMMKEWYFDLEEFRAEVGFEFRFQGQGEGCDQYTHKCVVLEVEPLKKLSYSWQYVGYEGYSVVSFELTSKEDGTHLKLTHTGLESFPQNNPDLSKEGFAGGWTQLIGESLTNQLEAL